MPAAGGRRAAAICFASCPGAVGLLLGLAAGCESSSGARAERTEMPTTAPGTPVTDLIQPTTRPVRLPPPKIIPESTKEADKDTGKATLIYPCRHTHTTTLMQAIEGLLSPEGTVHASPALNSLIVSDRKDVIQSLLEVLEELDTPRNQLLVEARVVEVSANRDLEYEIRHTL